LVGPSERAWEHVRLLARLARVCTAPGALDRLRSADNADDLFNKLIAEDQRHV